MPIPPFPQPYRSPVIPSMSEFFGVDASDVFDEREKAEGYLAGVAAAKMLHNAIKADHGDRSRAYQEALLEGLRESL